MQLKPFFSLLHKLRTRSSRYCFNENQEYGSYSAKHLSLSIHYKSTSLDFLGIIRVPVFGI